MFADTWIFKRPTAQGEVAAVDSFVVVDSFAEAYKLGTGPFRGWRVYVEVDPDLFAVRKPKRMAKVVDLRARRRAEK